LGKDATFFATKSPIKSITYNPNKIKHLAKKNARLLVGHQKT
jgi:hypothetical protein